VILNFPPPSTLHQLQSLQGKEKFLRCFILNYAEINLGFTRLLKKGFEFVWDTIAKKSFEYLKMSLTRALLLFPPNYSRDYFLYLAASDYTIAMVLVQEDDSHDEYIIYYLSRSLIPTKTINICGRNQSKKESLYLMIGPATCRAMRLNHLNILRSFRDSKPHSTYNLRKGTLLIKKDTNSDPYSNCFRSPLLHLVNCLFMLGRTASDQLKIRGSVHSMPY
jgi:hypothetical protein